MSRRDWQQLFLTIAAMLVMPDGPWWRQVGSAALLILSWDVAKKRRD